MKSEYSSEFFYCYDTNLFKYLKYHKKINFICTGNHIKTGKQFWQFWQTKELENAVKDFFNS